MVLALCKRVREAEAPLGVDSLTLRYWLGAKLRKQGLWTGEQRKREPSRMQRFYSGYTDPNTPRLSYSKPPALPVSSTEIYRTLESKPPYGGGLSCIIGERLQRSYQYWDEEGEEWHEVRAHMRKVRAQPIVGAYGFRGYVFCNAELHAIMSRYGRVRRVPATYLIHLPGTVVPLKGQPVATADW